MQKNARSFTWDTAVRSQKGVQRPLKRQAIFSLISQGCFETWISQIPRTFYHFITFLRIKAWSLCFTIRAIITQQESRFFFSIAFPRIPSRCNFVSRRECFSNDTASFATYRKVKALTRSITYVLNREGESFEIHWFSSRNKIVTRSSSV